MSFQTERLSPHMAAAVSGIDLNTLPDTSTRTALIDVLYQNLVLCIRGQALAPVPFRNATQWRSSACLSCASNSRRRPNAPR